MLLLFDLPNLTTFKTEAGSFVNVKSLHLSGMIVSDYLN